MGHHERLRGVRLRVWECIRVLDGHDESFRRHKIESLRVYQILGRPIESLGGVRLRVRECVRI